MIDIVLFILLTFGLALSFLIKNKLKRYVNCNIIFVFYFSVLIFSGQHFIMTLLHIFIMFLNISGTLSRMKQLNNPVDEYITEYNDVINNGKVKSKHD